MRCDLAKRMRSAELNIECAAVGCYSIKLLK
jgi:hypothetical protein